MKIYIVDLLGLPYDGDTLKRRGLGGSESAVISISRELYLLGFDVTVFNTCNKDDCKPGSYGGVNYVPLDAPYDEYLEAPDILISSRSVQPFEYNLPMVTEAKYKVLWLHDTFVDGDDRIEELIQLGKIDKIFTLSDFHTTYITNCDHGRKRNFEFLKNYIWQTRNGITLYKSWVDINQKDPHLMVYNASATKGLESLITNIWPKVLKERPEMKLVVIGGYYKFPDQHDAQEKLVDKLRDSNPPGVTFTGIIKQDEIADILAKASFVLYPTEFPETFGISTLEALAYNTPVITCGFGALEETAIGIACYKIPYPIVPNSLFPHIDAARQTEAFVQLTLNAIDDDYLHYQKMNACNQVKDVCTWQTVAMQWKQHFYKVLGKYLSVEEHRLTQMVNDRVQRVFGRRFLNPEMYHEPRARKERNIVVITPMYNNSEYVRRCVDSVLTQDYHNWKMYIIDDASTDNTIDYIPDKFDDPRIHIIRNEENMGAVYNQYKTIKRDCEPNDIIMLLDGDDCLVNNPEIFQKYNYMYQNGIEFTYGSCWSMADRIPLIAQEYPPDVKKNRSYRKHQFQWGIPYTHLRTFLAKHLFDIPEKSLKDENGKWFRAGGDGALFYELIERVDPKAIKAVPDIVVNYNDLNPINDYKINSDEQTKNKNAIVNQKLFSIIIPTMWRCVDILEESLSQLILHPLVGEIIIIDNDYKNRPDLHLLRDRKVRMIQMEKNIYVNPAWNLGVNISRYDLINLLNDDMVYDLKVLDKLKDRLKPGSGLYGIISGSEDLGQPKNTDFSIDFIELYNCALHHFGQCMFIHKADWEPIIPGLEINFGDEFLIHNNLYNQRPVWLIYNVGQKTRPNQTVKDEELVKGFYEREHPIYLKWLKQHPLDYLGIVEIPKKILIAIPTAKYIESDTFKSIYDLEIPNGYQTEFQTFYGYNIDQVRNLIADWVVKGYDYLFAVDSDIVFSPDTLKKLLSHNKDFITGVYKQRLPGNHIELYDSDLKRIEYDQMKKNALVEIGGCGLGCSLIRKKVFEDVGYPQFEYHSAIDHSNTFSEDVDFCNKARKKGYKIFADTSILCDHIGSKVFRLPDDRSMVES